MESKTLLLEKLKIEIEQSAENTNLEAWFYQAFSGVKGFFGTDKIILLGLNPSSGTFPSEKDKLLYETLKAHHLENAHITDFVKVRAKNKDVQNMLQNKELIAKQVKFFIKELDIIRPKAIIAMGFQCEELLKENCHLENIKIFRIKHYGYRYQTKEKVFQEINQSLANIINSLQ